MFKGFLTGFIIAVLAIALILYVYGRKSMSDMSSAKTDAFVESTTETSSIKNWIDYTPLSKKFTAKFPSSPQRALDRAIDAKTKEEKQYEMYISESSGNVFMISVISFLNTDKIKVEKTILKDIVDKMVTSNPGNTLEKIQYGTYQGRNDADFVITNKAYTITGRAFVDRNQLYVLSTLSKTTTESKNEFDYFINSFNLVPVPDGK